MRFAPALRFFRRNPAPVLEQDPADLGTAFGMEASLEGENNDFRPSTGEYELESARQRSEESPLAWLSSRRSN